MIQRLSEEAEAGYDPDQTIARRGDVAVHPSAPYHRRSKSVRLDPELKERLARRAAEEGVTVSEVIRDALRHHLEAS